MNDAFGSIEPVSYLIADSETGDEVCAGLRAGLHGCGGAEDPRVIAQGAADRWGRPVTLYAVLPHGCEEAEGGEDFYPIHWGPRERQVFRARVEGP